MTNVLSFARDEFESGVIAFMPCIDGEPFGDIVERYERLRGYTDPAGGYGGLVPAFYRYGPATAYFLGIDTVHGDYKAPTYFLGCQCGEVGCWPIEGNITVEDSEVVWGEFTNPYRPERDYTRLGPFRFERTAYLKAVSELNDVWG